MKTIDVGRLKKTQLAGSQGSLRRDLSHPSIHLRRFFSSRSISLEVENLLPEFIGEGVLTKKNTIELSSMVAIAASIFVALNLRV